MGGQAVPAADLVLVLDCEAGGNQASMARTVTGILVAAVGSTGKYAVVSNESRDRALQELAFSLSNLEAAAACCPLVVSNRASEFEYFGDCVRYCDPANWHTIAAAVINAMASFDVEKGKREELRNRLMSACTWEAAAEATLRAYERAIGERHL